MALWPFAGAHASSVTTSVLGFVAFFFQWGLIHMMLRGPTCNAHGTGVRAQAAQQGARKLEWLYLYQLASRFRAVVPGVIPKSEYEADVRRCGYALGLCDREQGRVVREPLEAGMN